MKDRNGVGAANCSGIWYFLRETASQVCWHLNDKSLTVYKRGMSPVPEGVGLGRARGLPPCAAGTGHPQCAWNGSLVHSALL